MCFPYNLCNGLHFFKLLTILLNRTLFYTLPSTSSVSRDTQYNATFLLKVCKYAIFIGIPFLPRMQCPSDRLFLYTNEHDSLFSYSNFIHMYRVLPNGCCEHHSTYNSPLNFDLTLGANWMCVAALIDRGDVTWILSRSEMENCVELLL